MMNLSYPEILTLNQKLNLDKKLTPYKVSILSNITINQIKEVLDYSLKLSGVKSKISIGQYDNITQEVSKHNQSDLVIIFFELANLKENFHTKINLLSEKELREFTDFFKSTIDMILSNLKKTPLVLFNKFSPLIFSSFTVEKNKLEKISDELNIYLEKKNR